MEQVPYVSIPMLHAFSELLPVLDIFDDISKTSLQQHCLDHQKLMMEAIQEPAVSTNTTLKTLPSPNLLQESLNEINLQ